MNYCTQLRDKENLKTDTHFLVKMTPFTLGVNSINYSIWGNITELSAHWAVLGLFRKGKIFKTSIDGVVFMIHIPLKQHNTVIRWSQAFCSYILEAHQNVTFAQITINSTKLSTQAFAMLNGIPKTEMSRQNHKIQSNMIPSISLQH